jgi:hypothetical protein
MSLPARKPTQTPTATPADLPILRALNTYKYLAADQIRRLYYGEGVITYVRSRLKRLADGKYITRLEQPHFRRVGSEPLIFRLANRGYRLLEDLGTPAPRLPDERPASFLFYQHTLALNNALIAAELLTRCRPEFSITRLEHERELHHSPARVQLADGREVSVVPDAFLQIHEVGHEGPGYVTNIVFEMDLGTREKRSWAQKIEALQAFIEGPYTTQLTDDSLTIAVLTPLGQARALELLKWTEAELSRLNRGAYGRLYCIAGVDPTAVTPETLYLSAKWHQPFRSDPVPLVLQGEEGN